MSVKVGINGFGRIGRCVLRACLGYSISLIRKRPSNHRLHAGGSPEGDPAHHWLIPQVHVVRETMAFRLNLEPTTRAMRVRRWLWEGYRGEERGPHE